jgi:hypothetical protein
VLRRDHARLQNVGLDDPAWRAAYAASNEIAELLG